MLYSCCEYCCQERHFTSNKSPKNHKKLTEKGTNEDFEATICEGNELGVFRDSTGATVVVPSLELL